MAAPIGNRNGAKAREWTDALKWALQNYEGTGIAKGQALRQIARKVIEEGLQGNPQAIAEIGNRLEGKAVQPVDVDATIRTCDIDTNPLNADEWLRTYGQPGRQSAN